MLRLLLLLSAAIGLSYQNIIIKAEPGDNVILPCKDLDQGGIIVIEWSRTDLGDKYVFLFRNGHIDHGNQHQSYKNRADLLLSQMKVGDASLILKNATIDDSGTYECRVVQTNIGKKLISIVNLHVAPLPPPPPPPAAGGNVYTVKTNTELNISSCPITYFGQKYDRLYLNFTSENLVLCFNGFYDPQSRGDCLVTPQTEGAELVVGGTRPFSDQHIVEIMPTLKTSMECLVGVETVKGEISVFSFGSQAAFIIKIPSAGPTLADVLVDGNKVRMVNTTRTTRFGRYFGFADLSGCRSSGVLFRPGDVVGSDPETCSTLSCSQTAVLQNVTSGSTGRCQGNGM